MEIKQWLCEQLRVMSEQLWATDTIVEPTHGTLNYQDSALGYWNIWQLLDATDNHRRLLMVTYIWEKLLIFLVFPDAAHAS